LLAVPEAEPEDFDAILKVLAEASSGALTYPPGPSVLAEGYTTADPRGFARELRSRMRRNGRVHRGLNGRKTSPAALRDFLSLARHEPCLTLARYLFSADDVIDRVLAQVRTSAGRNSPVLVPVVDEEAETLVGEWPEYEKAILRRLLEGSTIYWVDEATPGRMTSLVEYPVGTVVLVVKPPGSDLEFEIKRAGRRGEGPLSVVFERDGHPVCSTHRLDAGSIGTNLRAEAVSAATLNSLFRLTHERPAPIPLTLSHRTIFTIPCRAGQADLLDYFTDPAAFGRGFGAMRDAMARSIPALMAESGTSPIDLPGDLGATVEFLALVNPSQSVIAPTTAYRLDLIDSYLSPNGPALYFRRGLGIDPTAEDSRLFAGMLLDVVLGTHEPVAGDASNYGAFIAAQYAHPDNRRQANALYLDLAEQAGEFWGTLYGLKASSLGESVVGRNVGLRPYWTQGAWRVRLVFMDHDQLRIPLDGFRPDLALWGLFIDATHLALAPRSGRRSCLDLLATIYRVEDFEHCRGREAFLIAAREAFGRARDALRGDPRVRALYAPECLDASLAWDEAISEFVRCRCGGSDVAVSAEQGAELLRRLGRPRPEADSFPALMAEYDDFFGCFAPLFLSAAHEPDWRGSR
jgi:hypothetical protein